MQCNQAFCGIPFTNGPFCSSYNSPLQSNQSMYPEIVGEGQVTSITLPDGSVQFFFMPTLKWRSANATQSHPFAPTPNPMFANNNYSIPPPCNNNGGSWFIRSIVPFPQNVYIPPSPRNEFPRLGNTDFSHNLNSLDFGQVKFHNDAWSSTTDLVYFYPSLRQRDFVYTLPCKDKTVQIDTGPDANNTVCHYELVYSKPCHCSVPAPAAPMSLECLVDLKSTPKDNNMSTDDSCCSKQSCKRGRDKKNKQEKSKNIMCACDSKVNIASVDKSITTYADEGCDCTPTDGRETQTRRSDRADTKPVNKALLKPKWTAKSFSGDSMSDDCSCDITKKPKRSQDNAETKLMKIARLKTRWPAKSYSGDSMSVECSCNDVSKKSNYRSEEKPMNKAPKKSKRTAKNYRGGYNMSVECSCDDLSKKPNNRAEDKTEAEPMHKALLMPKWTLKSKSGQSTSVECSCDDFSKKPNNRSQDDADAKPMHKALLMPKWIAKSYSGDSMTDDCSCDDASKKPKRRVKDKTYKRCRPKWVCGCDSDNSVANKGGRETSYTNTCSTCSIKCCTPVLKSKYSPKDVAQKPSSEKLDNVCPDCELKDEEMRETSTKSSCEKLLDRKSSEHLLDSSCLDCDPVASTCDGFKGE